MKQFTQLIACLSLLLACTMPSFAQLTPEEEAFWKDKADAYRKNHLSLKHDFEQKDQKIKEVEDRYAEVLRNCADSQSVIDSLKWQIIQLKGEMGALEREHTKLETAYKAQKRANNDGIKLGLVYRVQIGAFVFHQMDSDLVGSDDIMEERSDGFNKYLLGNFRTYEEATRFRAELKKAGLEDAWIVPYIDGLRATIAEADEYLEKQGGGIYGN